MSEKDITPAEIANVKRQLQRVSALGEGKVTVTFKDHRLVSIGIFAEIGLNLNDSHGTLGNPKRELELLD